MQGFFAYSTIFRVLQFFFKFYSEWISLIRTFIVVLRVWDLQSFWDFWETRHFINLYNKFFSIWFTQVDVCVRSAKKRVWELKIIILWCEIYHSHIFVVLFRTFSKYLHIPKDYEFINVIVYITYKIFAIFRSHF